jgi:hypothetical protein
MLTQFYETPLNISGLVNFFSKKGETPASQILYTYYTQVIFEDKKTCEIKNQ